MPTFRENSSDGDTLNEIPTLSGMKFGAPLPQAIVMSLWAWAKVEWRAVCAERCTYGSGRGSADALPTPQYLCGEEFFQHELPFDRSSMTRWRQRMGEERIAVLLQESLAVAVKTGAMKPQDTRRVIVDTTVQPKNVMFPTDAKLIHRARERLVRLARKTGLDLRQSYVRVGKLALIKHQRYAHAKQFKRAGKALRKLKTYLGRTIRDIQRQIVGDAELDAVLKWPLY